MSVNAKSIFTSGLVSGLLINVSAIAMVPMVGDQFDKVLASRDLPPLSSSAMAFFSGVSFIMGFFLVWLYAVAKVQSGPGIKTAVMVPVVFWFFAYLIPNVSMVVYGFMPVGLTVIGTAWGLVELVVASIVGAALYKEAKPVSHPRPATAQ
jgi:hypothetical protein